MGMWVFLMGGRVKHVKTKNDWLNFKPKLTPTWS